MNYRERFLNALSGGPVDRLLEHCGNQMCFIGGIDGRVLRGSEEDIEREVATKVGLARQGRVIPCLGTHVLPEIEYEKYRHYARCLRSAVGA